MATQQEIADLHKSIADLRRKMNERSRASAGDTYEVDHPRFSDKSIEHKVTQDEIDTLDEEIDTLRQQVQDKIDSMDLSVVEVL